MSLQGCVVGLLHNPSLGALQDSLWISMDKRIIPFGFEITCVKGFE